MANWQYEYDHRQDQALFMDKRYIERRLEVMHTVYEQNKEQAAQFAGPAVMETFGEKPFSPKAVPKLRLTVKSKGACASIRQQIRSDHK